MGMKDYIDKMEDLESYTKSMHELIVRYDIDTMFNEETIETLVEATFPNIEDNSLVLMASTVDEGDNKTWDNVVTMLMDSETEEHVVISSMLGKAIAVLTQYEALLALTTEALNSLRRPDGGD